MKNLTFIISFILLAINGTAIAKNEEKEYFNSLVQMREDIPAHVIKQVKKDMGYFSDSYPRIHDSWIENPYGLSIDLQGNTLFPEFSYIGCKQISPSHFELKSRNGQIDNKGVVRTDGTVIVPMENGKIEYFSKFNIIYAYVGWEPNGLFGPNKGQVKVYDFYGNLLRTIDNVTRVSTPYDLKELSTTFKTDAGDIKLNFPPYRTDKEQDQITKFYSDGPQATTYNIIQNLCSSNKKGDQQKAVELLTYYINYILPDDHFARTYSSACWDATLRYLACVNFTKDYKKILPSEENSGFCFTGPTPAFPAQLALINKGLPEVIELAQQAEPLLMIAANECQQKQIKEEQRMQAWMTVLGVLANSLNSTGGYKPMSGSNYTTNTTTIPTDNTGKTTQTNINPDIMGASVSAGWSHESPSGSNSNSTSTTHSSSKRTCHACFGKGTHQSCNGSGTQLAFGNKRTEKCSGCHGSGKCPQCNGLGYHQ